MDNTKNDHYYLEKIKADITIKLFVNKEPWNIIEMEIKRGVQKIKIIRYKFPA